MTPRPEILHRIDRNFGTHADGRSFDRECWTVIGGLRYDARPEGVPVGAVRSYHYSIDGQWAVCWTRDVDSVAVAS
jgi:hypothetical protein